MQVEPRSRARREFISALRNRVGSLLGRQRFLFLNAGLLTLGTATSSVFGFCYWILAARHFPPAAVGYAAAAVSLMGLFGHLGECGLGTLLMGKARIFAERSSAIISAALLVGFGASALLALGYTAISASLPASLGQISSFSGDVLFLLCCACCGLGLVLDGALAGLSRIEIAVARNVVTSVMKLILVAVGPMFLSANLLGERFLLLTWLIGMLVAFVPMIFINRIKNGAMPGRVDFGSLQDVVSEVLGHHVLNIASLAPGLLLPAIVTIELTPSTNAAFYAAWALINVAFLAPNYLAVMVFAEGSKSPPSFAGHLRASLGMAMLIGIVVALVCYFGSFFILSLFSPAYASIANVSLQLLGISIFPMAIKLHFVAIQRFRNRMAAASLLVALGALFELAGAVLGARHGDLLGLTVGWLLGLVCETLIMAPSVIGVLFPQLYARALAMSGMRAEIAEGEFLREGEVEFAARD